ncbi:MAG: hypothetical protein RL322_156 [Pseudomonadota bacterium]|jgi:DNA-binding transcriptional LysR family regulator
MGLNRCCPASHPEPNVSALVSDRVSQHTDVIGFIPRPLDEAAADAIRIVPVKEPLPKLHIHAITPAKAILTPAARALMSAIRASAGR